MGEGGVGEIWAAAAAADGMRRKRSNARGDCRSSKMARFSPEQHAYVNTMICSSCPGNLIDILSQITNYIKSSDQNDCERGRESGLTTLKAQKVCHPRPQ